MIPYPSSSPAPVNATESRTFIDSTGAIVSGVAIGAIGVGGIMLLVNHLNLLKHLKSSPNAQEETNIVKIEIEDGFTYLCVKTSDLEEIKQLLFAFKKEYHILDYCR